MRRGLGRGLRHRCLVWIVGKSVVRTVGSPRGAFIHLFIQPWQSLRGIPVEFLGHVSPHGRPMNHLMMGIPSSVRDIASSV